MKGGLVRQRGLVVLVVCAVYLAGCAGTPPAPTLTPIPASTLTSTPPPRQAVLSELRNEVLARPGTEVQWQTATEGQSLQLGGGVETKTEAKVRVDISDGTLLRFAANTLFEFKEFSLPPTDPVTRLYLDAGKVWAAISKALGTGAFDVETPVGVAGVRGSMISVEYDPAHEQMIVTCLEGRCSLTSANGASEALSAGEQAEITGRGQPPSAKHTLLMEQYLGWQQNFPEAAAVLMTITPMLAFTASPQPRTATPPPTETPSPVATASASPTAGRRQTAVATASASPTTGQRQTAAATAGSSLTAGPGQTAATVGPGLALSPEEQANYGTFAYTYSATYSGNCGGPASGTRQVHTTFTTGKAILDWQGEGGEYNKIGTNTYQAKDSTGVVVTLTFTLDGFRAEIYCVKWVFKK